jgi:hypothetical protein
MALIASPRTAAETGEFSALSPMTGLKTLVTSLAGHVAAASARSAPALIAVACLYNTLSCG